MGEQYGDKRHGVRGWLARRWPLILVGLLPALLIALGSARFILNHFFARAPYLQDSGLLSGVVYRSGLSIAPPEIACNYAASFYQVYFSPIISALSAISYIVPVRRIEWFVFVQALVYLPLGLVVYSLASQLGAFSRWRLVIATVAALAFSFSGIVLWMIGYPHYEAATPALICITLGAVVTGRTRLTWIAIALAVSVRQDGGLHVAVALAPLVYLKWRGTEMVPSQRRLLVTIGIAVAASVAGFACQRLLWPPVDRMTPVYFGTPKYAHITWALMSERLRDFYTDCQLIYYPFFATVLIAILRRDVRYLFGWAATLPWFLFNFTAFDGAKATFAAYTAGPFLVAMFWVYVYGAKLARPERRFSPGVIEAVFALMCVLSTIGSYRGRPWGLSAVARDMAIMQRIDREAVHGFADVLLTHPPELGELYIDSPVAALVQEGFTLRYAWSNRHLSRPDSYAFYRQGLEHLPEIMDAELDHCLLVVSTRYLVCARAPVPATTFANLEIIRMPAMFVFTRTQRPGVRVTDRGAQILAGYSLQGPLGELAAGRYVWTLDVEGDVLARIDPDEATKTEWRGTGKLEMPFDADGKRRIDYRITAMGPTPLVIKGVTLRRLAADPAGR